MILLYTTDMHTSPEHIFLMLCIESDKVVDSVIGDDFVCIWYVLNVINKKLNMGNISVRHFNEKSPANEMIIASLHGHIHEVLMHIGSINIAKDDVLRINQGRENGKLFMLNYLILN